MPAWHSDAVAVGERCQLGGELVEALGGPLGLLRAVQELDVPSSMSLIASAIWSIPTLC